jgi:hypothetical protein
VILQECGWTIHSGADKIQEGHTYTCCVVAGPAMNDAKRVNAQRVVYFLPDDRLGVEEVTHQFRSDGPWSDELSFTAETVEDVLEVRSRPADCRPGGRLLLILVCACTAWAAHQRGHSHG